MRVVFDLRSSGFGSRHLRSRGVPQARVRDAVRLRAPDVRRVRDAVARAPDVGVGTPVGARPPVTRFWLAPPPVARRAAGRQACVRDAMAHSRTRRGRRDPGWCATSGHAVLARATSGREACRRQAGMRAGCSCAFAHPTWASGPRLVRDLRSRGFGSRYLRSRGVPQARVRDAVAPTRTRRGRRDPGWCVTSGHAGLARATSGRGACRRHAYGMQLRLRAPDVGVGTPSRT